MMNRMSLLQIMSRVLAIALPISGGRLLTIFSSFIAMMMVARFGELSLAAGFLATTGSTTILVLTSTVFYAIGIRIRYYQGQQNAPVLIGLLVKNGLFLAMMIGFPSAIAITYMDKMLLAIGEEPELVALTTDYFHYAGIGMFPMLFMMVIGQFYVGIGKPNFTLVVGLISLPLTVILSYGLVLGNWGLPQLGLSGVSLANLLVQIFMLIGALVVICCTKVHHRYGLFQQPFLLDWHVCLSILNLGFPIGLQLGGELIAMAAANYLMGYFGVDALAALQITSQYSMIVIMLNFGLAQAMSCLVSEAYGAQQVNLDLIKKYIIASLVLLGIYILPVSILFCTLPTELAQFYMDSHYVQPELTYLVRIFFALGAVFLLLDGVRNLLSSILRGLHDSKAATQINLIAMWLISLPVSGLIVFVFKSGPITLRVGFLSGFMAAVIGLVHHLYKKLAPVTHSVNSVTEKIGSVNIRQKPVY